MDVLCSKTTNKKINHIHERALRLVHNDYTSSFTDLLEIDKSLSIHHHNIHVLATEMYKVKKNICPSFMKEIFSYNENTDKFLRPNVRTVRDLYRDLYVILDLLYGTLCYLKMSKKV